jgi:hypothetical protein
MEHERHTYEVQVQVPRVVPVPGRETTWRTVAPPARFEEANSTGTHLRDSLILWGFDEAEVNAWFDTHVRCIEYLETTRRLRELPMHRPS